MYPILFCHCSSAVFLVLISVSFLFVTSLKTMSLSSTSKFIDIMPARSKTSSVDSVLHYIKDSAVLGDVLNAFWTSSIISATPLFLSVSTCNPFHNLFCSPNVVLFFLKPSWCLLRLPVRAISFFSLSKIMWPYN